MLSRVSIGLKLIQPRIKPNMPSVVTQQQIATQAGVSRTAVSKVLAGKAAESRISPALSKRILKVAERLNYRPNAAARAVRSARSMQVAIVTSSYGDRPFEDSSLPMIMGVNDRLARSNYTGMLVRVNELKQHLADQSRVFTEHTVDGVLAMNTVDEAAARQIAQRTHQCVYLDSDWWAEKGCIRRDEYAVGYRAAELLTEGGFQALAWFGPMPTARPHYSVRDRYRGALDFAEKHAVPFEVIECNTSRDFNRRDEQLRELAGREVGLVVYDARLLEALSYRMPGMCAGADRPFGFACCDDKYAFTHTWPEVCRPVVDRFGLGEMAAQMLVEQLELEQLVDSQYVQLDWIPGTTATRR